ncbi:MAG: hypothetical protein KUL84_13005 [Diaphorobacter sp.]|nr:hypothetical protein [Diaphorobacter sp.]
MEAILVITILGIGLFIGLAAVRNALFKYYLARQDTSFVVYDSSSPTRRLLGTAVGFDEHQAPLLAFVDYGVVYPSTGNPRNLRALVGVRKDRFTSRQPVFYSGNDCTGTVCIAVETTTGGALVPDVDSEAGPIAQLYAMQDGPSYAVGAGPGGNSGTPANLQGALYRSGEAACSGTMQSMWVSRQLFLTSGSLCVPVPGSLDESRLRAAVEVETTSGGSPVNVLQVPAAPFYVNMVSTPLQTSPLAPVAEGDS